MGLWERATSMTAVLAALAALPAGAEKQYWTELQPEQPASATTAAPPAVNHGLPNLSALVERASPAVVSIIVEEAVPVELDPSDPLHDFFDRFYGDAPNEGLGTGFVIDPSGLIVTNSHVVEHARKIRVILEDDGYPQELEAEVVGRDPETDLALLQVQVDRQLPVLPLGNSDEVQTADWVVAIGNPFGLAQSVTFGIVSQINRSDVTPQGRDGYFDFIQTDASINPGNSGGALVNLRGELVGINTASFNVQGSMAGNIGLGFAIPSNLAGSVMRQLYATGEVRRGTLGVDTQTVDERIARGLGLETARGAIVTRVHPGSSGEEAGLRAGDVIVAANGQRIDNSESLRNFQGLQPVDTAVTLEVMRDGRVLELSARLREIPRDGASYDPRLTGAVLADLPEALRRSAGDRVSGVRIESVEPGSRAARNGLRAGDLILASSGGPFRDLAGFRAALSESPDELILVIQRGRSRGQLRMQ